MYLYDEIDQKLVDERVASSATRRVAFSPASSPTMNFARCACGTASTSSVTRRCSASRSRTGCCRRREHLVTAIFILAGQERLMYWIGVAVIGAVIFYMKPNRRGCMQVEYPKPKWSERFLVLDMLEGMKTTLREFFRAEGHDPLSGRAARSGESVPRNVSVLVRSVHRVQVVRGRLSDRHHLHRRARRAA